MATVHENDAEIIRFVERTVLDLGHKRFALLRQPVHLAVLHLLRITLHALRDQKQLSHLDPQTRQSWQSNFLRAVSFCFRWANSECPHSSPAELPPSADLDEQAERLIFEWGMPYAEIVTDHVAWSNGLLTAQVDLRDKRICFGPGPAMNIADFVEQHATALQESNAEWNAFPAQHFTPLFNDWQQHAEWTGHGLEFRAEFVAEHERFPQMESWMRACLLPELEGDVTLGAYTLDDLRRFLSVALTTAECVTALESAVDERVGPNNGMGSWIFTMSASRAARWYATAATLPVDVVKVMLDDLTGDLNRFHFSVAATPIIRVGEEMLIGQRLLAFLRPSHFVVRALTTGSGKRRYDHVSTLLERARLDAIEGRLRSGGLRVLREPEFVSNGGERITPDLIVWDDSCAQVVVIDFKNALSATGAAEVVRRLREYRKGIAQLEGYLAFLRERPSLLADRLGRGVGAHQIRGGLLFWTPLALPVARHAEVATDTWSALTERIGAAGEISLQDLFPARGVDSNAGYEVAPRDLKFGDWTYRRYRWVKPDAQGQFWPSS